ncbi:MAG: LPS export ABC transporter permease LptG [Proteobacteria bacterium]|jgi:lipopolysaccharide export system permease protein|nr:LPS export ABC transporter permease LptG [Pseudomonadota bacterium]
MMRTLDIYIGRNVMQQTMVVFAVLLGLFTFISFIDELGDLGTGDYGIVQLIQFVVLSIPMLVYEVFPMAALLGCILALSAMARDSELVVMRAAGISINRLVISVLKVGAILAIGAIAIGELVTPFTEDKALKIKNESMQGNLRQQSDFGVWMRDEDTYVKIGEVLPDLSLLDVKIFEFDEAGRLRALSSAEQGQYVNNRWTLTGLNRTQIFAESSNSAVIEAAYWNTEVDPAILQVFLIQPEQLSAWQLYKYIDHLDANKQDTANYELVFWQKIIVPFTTAVMLMLAIPFVFVQTRGGGLGRSLFIGIMVGLGFFVVNKSFTYFVLLYNIPPLFGAISPTLVVLLISTSLLRKLN